MARNAIAMSRSYALSRYRASALVLGAQSCEGSLIRKKK